MYNISELDVAWSLVCWCTVMDVAFIGRRELTYAFTLIGVSAYVIDDLSEAEDLFEELVKANISVLILEEDVYKHLCELDVYKPSSLVKPILIVIPSLKGSEGYRLRELYGLISQAVGVKLELER